MGLTRAFLKLPLLAVVGCWLCGIGNIQAQEIIRIGYYENPPKVFRDGEGQPAGFFVELAEAIAKEYGWKLEWHYGEWADHVAATVAGDLDMLVDVAITDQRAAKLSFNEEVVLSNWSVFYSLPRNRPTVSLHDLDHATVVVLRESVQAAELREVARLLQLEVTLLEVDSYDAAFRAVSERSADFALVNQLVGSSNSRNFPQLMESDMVFQPTALYFAFPKSGPAGLRDLIDASIRRQKAEAESPYNRAMQRWIDTARPGFRVPSAWDRMGPALLFAGLLSASAFLLFQWLLRKRTAQLRQHILKLKEREQELIEARNAAEAANRAKTEFLAVVNHELRTPLNAIIGPSEMLIEECKNPEHRDLMKMIHASAEQLLRLINDILDLTWIESGQGKLRTQSFVLNDDFCDQFSLYREMATGNGLKFEIQYTGEAQTRISTDPILVRQIVRHLLDNAIKYTDCGSVELSFSLQNPHSGAHIGNNQLHLLIQVKDTGRGVPIESRSKIFEPFQQADMSTSRQYEGIGMGLTIAARFAQKLGGRLWLESSGPDGSCFCAVIPVVTAHSIQ